MKEEKLTYMSWEDFLIKIIASVRDTGKSIHGTYKGKKNHA